LFGGASVSASNIDVSSNLDIDPSVSKELGLELVGTISGAPEAARAIIKNTKTKVLETYKTGQRIADARIEAIEADAVVLEYKGQMRVLGLNSWRSKGTDGRYASSADSGINARPSSNDAVITSKAGYIQKLLSKAVISPYVVDGRVEGLEITGLENLSEGETFGLKNGDIVHSVNGHSLTSKQKAFQILKKARSQDAISVEMSRNNRVNEISWPLR
jgi:type II secretion system protein C